ncbi:hypothetical protein B738_23828 [Photorhabdus temperata subsp. temperata M1021]|nr:hypothetical protein B738_23828 [Photorhabdus temperata subsp. temperata M1021]
MLKRIFLIKQKEIEVMKLTNLNVLAGKYIKLTILLVKSLSIFTLHCTKNAGHIKRTIKKRKKN